MKNFLSRLFTAALTLLAVTSCSDSGSNAILENVPADAEFVAVGKVNAMLESAGISIDDSKLKLPSYITKYANDDDFDDIKTMLKKGCIDLDCCAAMAVKLNDSFLSFIFRTTDPKKFIDYIEDEGFKEKGDDDGVKYYLKNTYEGSYGSEYDFVAVNGDIVYWLNSVWLDNDESPKAYFKQLTRIIEDAHDKNYTSTAAGKYISQANAVGVALNLPRKAYQRLSAQGISTEILDMLDGTICIKGDISGKTATAELKVIDENGKTKKFDAMKDYINTGAKVSKSALDYIGKGEQLVYAVALKDVNWDDMLDDLAKSGKMSRSERGYMNIAKGYLEKIDGTVAVGVGITNGLQSLLSLNYGEDVFNNLTFTLVAETAEGKAKSLANDIKGMLDAMNMDYDKTSDGFAMDIPGYGATIYCAYTDDVIVLANHKIKKGNDNAAVDYMPSATFGMALGIDKSDELMRDIEVDENLNMSISSGAGDGILTMKADITGKYGVIGNFMQIVLGLAYEHNKRVNQRYQQEYNYYEDDYDYYYDDDEVVSAEAVEEDYWE